VKISGITKFLPLHKLRFINKKQVTSSNHSSIKDKKVFIS
jgi:hypothetical protein